MILSCSLFFIEGTLSLNQGVNYSELRVRIHIFSTITIILLYFKLYKGYVIVKIFRVNNNSQRRIIAFTKGIYALNKVYR